jgi:GYF domain
MATYTKSKRKDWRKKLVNNAKIRYDKEQILTKFISIESPSLINIPSQLFCVRSTPILSQIRQVRCENSRKIIKNDKKDKKDKNEKKDTKEKKIEYKIEIIPETSDNEKKEFEDEYNQELQKASLSALNTSGLSHIIAVPNIKYPLNLIYSHVIEGNPFACIIDEASIKQKDFLVPTQRSFEKIWYYKDPLDCVHGPYSSIEMFNWAAAGYFTTSLQVAVSSTDHFYSLNMFISLEKLKPKQVSL